MKIFDKKPTMIRCIGDVHGIFDKYNELIKSEYPTIQVGDFGAGFGPFPKMQNKDAYIRGNHDNPAICKEHLNWIADGHVEHNIMFIGGGLSRDRDMRTIGVDWWDDEELSYEELENMIDLAEKEKPAIIISHECPKSIAASAMNSYPPHSRTSMAFDVIFSNTPPKLWVFGHYHRSMKFKVENTLFICCAIDEAVDIDVSGLI